MAFLLPPRAAHFLQLKQPALLGAVEDYLVTCVLAAEALQCRAAAVTTILIVLLYRGLFLLLNTSLHRRRRCRCLWWIDTQPGALLRCCCYC